MSVTITKKYPSDIDIDPLSAISLELATEGGNTPKALNIGSGGLVIGQNNGNGIIKSLFAGKQLLLQDDSLVTQLAIDYASGKLNFTIGANKAIGNATLVAGTVTISNTIITDNSIIKLQRKTAGGTIGDLTYTLIAGTSFTINSSNVLDTSIISYIIFN